MIHSEDHATPRYVIKEFNGSTYMFFEGKNGDYVIMHREPAYDVLKKIPSNPDEALRPRSRKVRLILLRTAREAHPPVGRARHRETNPPREDQPDPVLFGVQAADLHPASERLPPLTGTSAAGSIR